MLHIDSNFDSGAIEVIDTRDAADIHLALRADNAADFRQWFHFALHGARDRDCRLRFLNAGAAAYPEGWRDYRAVASYDRRRWFRVPGCAYDGQEFTIRFTPRCDTVWLAYFEPYSGERHLELLGAANAGGLARVEVLGHSLQGRELAKVSLCGTAPGRPQVWIIARQHPGETMAEWFMEGLLQRLLDGADPTARRLREIADLHLLPNMNPDGAALGNLRTNAAGANLNREWLAPSLERSPEVFHVRAAMERTGVDLFLDIHGDETLPYVFIDGSSMLPGFTAARMAREQAFCAALRAASADFQTRHGYAPDRFDDELLTLASKWVGHRFGCLSLTLEMPFKDNADLPDAERGWSAARSKRLGAAMLHPILADLGSA